MRGKAASVGELVNDGIITSGDVIAEVLPSLSASVNAAGIGDPAVRRVYATIYRSFRRRRSVLLVDLQSQVKLHELPWIAGLAPYRTLTRSAHDRAEALAVEATLLALRHFPYAILPNKLLQELRSLLPQAERPAVLVDELAADIFMGKFSPRFAQAASVAATMLQDSLYAHYYDIDYRALQQELTHPTATAEAARLRPRGGGLFGRWRKIFDPAGGAANAFSRLCKARADAIGSNRWDPAANGVIIEQQQILTTQNLAAVFSALDLAEQLGDELNDLARNCFQWICTRQQIPLDDWHASLVVAKNTSYAWRQMLFYLSLRPPSEMSGFADWLEDHFRQQKRDFVERFSPAVEGLLNLLASEDVERGRGERFLGWSGGNWRMPPTSLK